MKDFSQLLEQQQQSNKPKFHHALPAQQLSLQNAPIRSRTSWQLAKDKIAKVAGPVLLTIFTGPFNTASVLLQTSNKPISQSFARKLELAGPNSKLVKLGIYGDNKIYRAFEFKGYNDCLTQMGKQGFRGMYKGNLMGIILGVANTKIRTYLYEQVNKVSNFSQQWKSNLLTILTCTVADLITLPLLFCQTRLIFQNSTSNFRTYSGILDVFRSTSPKACFAGASVLVFKNIVFSYSWMSFFKQSPVQSFVFSTLLSHVLTYPFMTVIRQLQTNETGRAMMNQRTQSVRECAGRIWGQGGVWGFYRGFVGYALVHSFLSFIMIQMNVRSGYFNELF